MKKKFWNSKRILSLLLAVTLVMGQTGFVSAQTVSDNSIQRETTVSSNSTEDAAPETAYNGTPSRVIGLECDYDSYGNLSLMWNSLSTENKITTPDGKVIYIGYQIEENGKQVEKGFKSTDGKYWIYSGNYYSSNLELKPGNQVKYRVRGLYYTDVETATGWQTNVIAVGEWSDYYTYTVQAEKDAPVVTGLKGTAMKDLDVVRFTWNPVAAAGSYEIQYIYSDTPLTGLTNDNWYEFYEKDGAAYEAFENANPNAYFWSDEDWCSGPVYDTYLSSSYRYYYARVMANISADGYKYNVKYCPYVMCDAGPATTATQTVEQIKNFRVEYSEDGSSFTLRWDSTERYYDMCVYAYESANFPKHYYYQVLDAQANNGGYYENYSWNMNEALKRTIDKKVQRRYAESTDEYLNGRNFTLEYGKTYYFVAHTYSDENRYEDRKPIFTENGLSYTRYNDVSAPSAVVAVKVKVPTPTVYTEADKNEITLHMSGSSAHTGYEIYRKNGKKYKKIATTTDSFYVDEDLSTGKKYQYKVRAYNYNKNTKKKAYSAYAFVTGETVAVKSIDLTVKQKSKKKLSLKWTKVPGAYKYEIYRTTYDNGNPIEYAKENTAGKAYPSCAMDNTYELIKTFNKASATSYTDKKVVQGKHYGYRVVAYYKTGNTVNYVSASESVYLKLVAPDVITSLKGSTAKYSWDKNKYASGYEVDYRVYDQYGNATTKWNTIKTTKTSFSVTLPQGGYVSAYFRAYNKSKCYSEWTDARSIYSGLPVVKSIKAKNVAVKNNSGETVNAVKITWKPVSGAKYYMVYRGTKLGNYNKDTKTYRVNGQLIAKESNDDENYDEVPYTQYYDINGSIVGTSVYDYAQLDTGVSYYYYVVAYGERGTNLSSIYSHEDDSEGSGKPSYITYKGELKINTITNKKKGQAVLKWTKLSGAKKYYVYRSEKKKGGFKLIGTTKKATYTDKKVKKGKTYYYKIVVTGSNALKADFTMESSVKKAKIKK